MKHFRPYIGLLILSIIVPTLIVLVRCSVLPINANKLSLNQSIKTLSTDELKAITRNITVKVLLSGGVGSGTLIKHSQGVYIVLTNHHVIENEKTIQVQTFDKMIHSASLVNINFQGNDLALLQFKSNINYQVAQLVGLGGISLNETVFAGGYPYDAEVPSELVFNQGNLFDVTQKPLQKGYQLGYTNDIHKGMSGGPLLNQRGKVMGIHGINAFPIWGDPFIFADGKKPTQVQREMMIRYSWGIPMETVANLAKNYLSLGNNGEKKNLVSTLSPFCKFAVINYYHP